ncbi:MAG: sterol desaturase family protein [Desertifilum sp. SIO1I2]|nr:sterol desaturase family protein [Desertifilum sp. SIO1I2]
MIGHFVGRLAGGLSLFFVLSGLHHLVSSDLQNYIAQQPLFLQLTEAILVADFSYYIAHRLLHEVPFLWRFHAVHHSIEYLDWLATVRVHPADQIFTKLCQMIPIYWMGFSTQTLGIYALFSAAIAFYIHANIRLRVGSLKWLLATPEFHHWHHAKVPEVGNKNFAAQCPLFDLILGTLYLPRREMPQKYGIPEQVPLGYLAQLLYPFKGV